MELEYFYRQSKYDQTSDIYGESAEGESGTKVAEELVIATDRIGSVDSHNIFANLYYDFATNSRFTPYLGIGGGIGVTNMEYGSVWARNPYVNDPDTSELILTTGANLPNADMIQQNLARHGQL